MPPLPLQAKDDQISDRGHMVSVDGGLGPDELYDEAADDADETWINKRYSK
jgi:hypothetical protein